MKLKLLMPDEKVLNLTLPTMPRTGEILALDGVEYLICRVTYEFEKEVLTSVCLQLELGDGE